MASRDKNAKKSSSSLLRSVGYGATAGLISVSAMQYLEIRQSNLGHYSIGLRSDRNVSKLTDSNFEYELGKTKVPVLIDIWAPWCAYCKVYSPVIDNVANENSDVKFMRINSDENPKFIKRLGVKAIPTTLIVKDGIITAAHSGNMTKLQLEDWIEKSVSRNRNYSSLR